MDLNGKAGSRLATILIISVIIIAGFFTFCKPDKIQYYPYYQLRASIRYPHNGIAIGDRISPSKTVLNKLFGDNACDVQTPLYGADEEDWVGASEGLFMVGGVPFHSMHTATLGGRLQQVSYSKRFRGIKSAFESNKSFKTLCSSFKSTYGNELNAYKAWEDKESSSDHSFGILIRRVRIGFGFYSVKVLFTHPDYETQELYSGDDFYWALIHN